jgi:hypothetical protein
MKKTLALIFVVLLLSVAAMAEERKADATTTIAALRTDAVTKADAVMTKDALVEPAKAEAVEPSMVKRPSLNPEVPPSHKTQNMLLMAALWTATAMDIQSSGRLDPTRYHEVNKFGGAGGQIATSLAASGAAYLVQKYGGRRMRWLSSALLAGGAAGHAFGAIHNYSLK